MLAAGEGKRGVSRGAFPGDDLRMNQRDAIGSPVSEIRTTWDRSCGVRYRAIPAASQREPGPANTPSTATIVKARDRVPRSAVCPERSDGNPVPCHHGDLPWNQPSDWMKRSVVPPWPTAHPTDEGNRKRLGEKFEI